MIFPPRIQSLKIPNLPVGKGRLSNPTHISIEERKRKARERNNLEQTHGSKLSSFRKIAAETARARTQIMADWREFCNEILETDPDKIWYDLCYPGTPECIQAEIVCQRFFEDRIETRHQSRPDLGRGWVDVPIITSVKTVLTAWGALLIEANQTGLADERAQHSKLWNNLRLDFSSPKTKRNLDTPTFRIS